MDSSPTSMSNSSPTARAARRQAPYNALFAQLKRQQNKSDNITTFQALPAPGRMQEIEYPLDSSGVPLAPRRLWNHIKSHDFGPLHCFHDLPARTFLVPGDGPFGGLSMAACGLTRKAEQCKYWLNFNEIHQNLNNQLRTRQYTPRVTQSTALHTAKELAGLSEKDDEDIYDEALALSVLDFYGGHFLADGSLNPHSAALPLTLAATAAQPGNSNGTLRREYSIPAASTSAMSPPPPYSAPIASALPPYSLRIPSPHRRSHAHASSLHPYRARKSSVLARHTTPARGNFRTCLDLADDVGVPAHIFWSMFVLCKGCDHIMAGHFLQDHVCDLTEL